MPGVLDSYGHAEEQRDRSVSGGVNEVNMDTSTPKLLLGVGNVLQGDDGVGVYAVGRLAGVELPGVEVYEAGTTGPELAVVLERRQKIVVVDAIDAGAEPGTVFRLTPDEIQPPIGTPLSLHQLSFLHALEETRLLDAAPTDVTILAIQVADVESGIGLSVPVEAVIERVLELAIEELGLPTDVLQRVRASKSRASERFWCA
jgi:hydrogenase maturation protease